MLIPLFLFLLLSTSSAITKSSSSSLSSSFFVFCWSLFKLLTLLKLLFIKLLLLKLLLLLLFKLLLLLLKLLVKLLLEVLVVVVVLLVLILKSLLSLSNPNKSSNFLVGFISFFWLYCCWACFWNCSYASLSWFFFCILKFDSYDKWDTKLFIIFKDACFADWPSFIVFPGFSSTFSKSSSSLLFKSTFCILLKFELTKLFVLVFIFVLLTVGNENKLLLLLEFIWGRVVLLICFAWLLFLLSPSFISSKSSSSSLVSTFFGSSFLFEVIWILVELFVLLLLFKLEKLVFIELLFTFLLPLELNILKLKLFVFIVVWGVLVILFIWKLILLFIWLLPILLTFGIVLFAL